jgi:hypothetical protein
MVNIFLFALITALRSRLQIVGVPNEPQTSAKPLMNNGLRLNNVRLMEKLYRGRCTP